MTTIGKIAQVLAVVAFGTAANAQEEGKTTEVENNKLNGCIVKTLATEAGAQSSYRYEDGDRIKEAFFVNSSPAANQGHTIGTRIVLDGNIAEGMTHMQIRGIHDGTVENDGGTSAIDFVITPDPKDISALADSVMVSGTRPWNKPTVDPETVRSKTIGHLMSIRRCMQFG